MKNKAAVKNTILILGASGFIGNAIYKELNKYYKTYGTYYSSKLNANQHFYYYNLLEDDIFDVLNLTKPHIVISALRGNFTKQVIAHKHLCDYASQHNTRLLFISSANVFDAYSKYPSYETDKTLSHSIFGHFKIKIENMLLKLPQKQTAILRLPMVFGNQSPRIEKLKTQLNAKEAIEVFPNLILNVTTITKLTQQIHYIINQDKLGVFHLGSTDLVHHNDFITSVCSKISYNTAKFKQVYTTNDDRYLAVLPKYNTLPKHLQLKSEHLITELKL